MIKEVEITAELLKVLPLIKVNHIEREFNKEVVKSGSDGGSEVLTFTQQLLTIDSEDLFLSEDMINDMAFALDLAMQNAPDMDGERKYDEWVVTKLLSIAHYIKDHLYDLMTLMIQFSAEGLQTGFYRCKDSDMIWKKVS